MLVDRDVGDVCVYVCVCVCMCVCVCVCVVWILVGRYRALVETLSVGGSQICTKPELAGCLDLYNTI